MFEGIDGAGVFLSVGEAAVSEDAGYGLDVGTVAQKVCSTAVTGAVSSNEFFDTGTGDPVSKGLQAHSVTRKREDNLITVAVWILF